MSDMLTDESPSVSPSKQLGPPEDCAEAIASDQPTPLNTATRPDVVQHAADRQAHEAPADRVTPKATLRLRFKAAHLIEALDVVSIVRARPLTPQQGSAAYGFRCFRDEHGAPRDRIYSRGATEIAAVDFPLDDLEGEDSYTFPCDLLEIVRTIPADDITLEASLEETPSDRRFVVRFRGSSGMSYEHTVVDPQLISPCDREFAVAKAGGGFAYRVGILRALVGIVMPFLPHAEARGSYPEHLNTLQIFDQSHPEWAKGNGHILCADGVRAVDVECAHLENKGLTVHARHVPQLLAFLSTCSSNEVTVFRSTSASFAVERASGTERLFAWAHPVSTFPRYSYPGGGRSKYILRSDKASLLAALQGAKIAASRGYQDVVRLRYSHTDHALRFGARESAGVFDSFPVAVKDPADAPNPPEDFAYNVNLVCFTSLVRDVKADEIELHVLPAGEGRRGAGLRTVDRFSLDDTGKVVLTSLNKAENPSGGTGTHECAVVRFMSCTL